MDEAKRARELLGRVAPALAAQKRRGHLLEQIAWPREVEEKFFAAHASRLPEVEPVLDRDGHESHVAELAALEASIDGDEPVAAWLRRVIQSRVDEGRLLLAVGTSGFTERSRELYGGARTLFYEGKATNLDLADHLLERLKVHGWDEAADPEETPLTAEQLGLALNAHVDRMRPRMDVEIVIDPACTAKVLAGMKRVRVRPDATFPRWEAEGLWHHEVETHALTSQNGAGQPEAPFLSSGGPRTTRTQEGLAVFSELYNRVLTVHRIERLAMRVKLVDMAEQGASFLDLYRFLLERGSPPRDAYFDAQRICRGGRVEGSVPFTKDACYLSGLLHVYAFLNAFVRGGFRDETELLVCGRIDLDDITALVQLRALGILSRPRHRPRWLRRWDTLLPYFAFSSFLTWIDLTPVEAHYHEVIALAEAAVAARAPSRPTTTSTPSRLTADQPERARIVGGLGLALEDAQAGALVHGERRRMIERAGVDPDPTGTAAPGRVDREGEQVRAQPLPDELGEDTQVGDLHLAGHAPVELDVARGHARHVEDEDLDRGMLDDGGERRVVEPAAIAPEPGLAHGVVEVAVERDRGPRRVDDGDLGAG